MPRKNGQTANRAPLTTAQSLGTLVKSARDIMRKDKGLNGDLDRLPMLTWVMFLKFLDDLEIQREDEAKLAGKRFRPAIEAPYRWRDWAANPQGVTGDELLAFINQEECTRPDGSRGPGLFAYLRSLTSSNGDDRRDVIATVFRGVDNRMKSGYLLRDVINKVAGIHFTSHDELHTLGAMYETHAARDARRGRRLRRVLHAKTGRPFHGNGDRPSPRRDDTRSSLRHGRIPGRIIQSSREADKDRGGSADGAETISLRSRAETVAILAVTDEFACYTVSTHQLSIPATRYVSSCLRSARKIEST